MADVCGLVKVMHCRICLVIMVFGSGQSCSGRLMSKCMSRDSGVDCGGCAGRSGVTGVVYWWAGQQFIDD